MCHEGPFEEVAHADEKLQFACIFFLSLSLALTNTYISHSFLMSMVVLTVPSFLSETSGPVVTSCPDS